MVEAAKAKQGKHQYSCSNPVLCRNAKAKSLQHSHEREGKLRLEELIFFCRMNLSP